MVDRGTLPYLMPLGTRKPYKGDSEEVSKMPDVVDVLRTDRHSRKQSWGAGRGNLDCGDVSTGERGLSSLFSFLIF